MPLNDGIDIFVALGVVISNVRMGRSRGQHSGQAATATAATAAPCAVLAANATVPASTVVRAAHVAIFIARSGRPRPAAQIHVPIAYVRACAGLF